LAGELKLEVAAGTAQLGSDQKGGGKGDGTGKAPVPVLLPDGESEYAASSNLLTPVILIGILAFAGLLALAIWQKDWNWGFASAVALAATFLVTTQLRRPSRHLQLQLTSQALLLGDRRFALGDFAGWWRESEGDLILINLERKRGSFLPTSVLLTKSDAAQFADASAPFFPEVEPRQHQLGEKYLRKIRW
jgi:hypothetical protein